MIVAASAAVHNWDLNPLNLFGAGQSVVNFSASTILDGFSSWLAAGAASLTNHVAALVTASTSPNLTPGSNGFFLPVGTMLQLTTILVLPLLLVATMGAVLHQDLQRLGRIWGVALPGAMLAAGGAVELSSVALQVTDALCNVVTGNLAPSLTTAYANIGKTLNGSVLHGSPFMAALLAAVFVLGGMALWLELIVRSAAVYLAVFFLPLALAGLVWSSTTHWAKRMVELLAAVILSKFVIVVALSLSVRAIANGSSADDVLAGGAIFLLASFAPFVLLRFAPIIEAGAVAHLEGLSRQPLRAAESLHARAAQATASPLGALLAGHGSGGAQEQAPAATPVAQVAVASTGGQLDAEYDAMTSGPAQRSSPSSSAAASPGGGSRAGAPGEPAAPGAVGHPAGTGAVDHSAGSPAAGHPAVPGVAGRPAGPGGGAGPGSGSGAADLPPPAPTVDVGGGRRVGNDG